MKSLQALARLEVSYPNSKPYPIDVCLASNILEVGVDIDRLSLMSVVGQPKLHPNISRSREEWGGAGG